MLRGLVLLGALLPTALWAGENLKLPSGQTVSLIDSIANVPGNEGLAMRYRFLAPAISRDGGTVDADTAGTDMDWLCANYALPRLPSGGPKPAEIIISLSDMVFPFGEDHPEATQFINDYDISDGTCQPGLF